MKYETIDDLKRAEAELAEIDRTLDQESNENMIKAVAEITGVAVGAGTGLGAGGVAIYFAGIVGFSGPGIVTGLAAIGGVLGLGMLGGIAIVAAAPVVLGGGGFFMTRYLRSRKFKAARLTLRQHALARREFLERLIRESGELGESLDAYRVHLARLTQMINELA